jgi:glycosyltransferase involved in cell wall biosynthesis
MDRLKILWFNWRCWLNPMMGGAEVYTREICTRWVGAGHKVTLFTSKFPNCKSMELLDGVQVIRDGGKYSVYGKAEKYYRKYFRKEKFDFVIDEVNTHPFFTKKFVNNGERIVSLIHQLAKEYWFYETPFPINLIGYHLLEERWLRNYIDVPTFTVSNSTKLDLQKLGFKHVSVVPEGLNFVPLNRVPEKESFPLVVYAGRLKKAKRPDHLIDAFKTVKQRFPKAELWIMGDGDFKSDLTRHASSGVKFFSGLGNDQRRELMRRAWVLVNPSIREGFGLNIIEANALGVPCIAYDVGGLRDSVLNGKTGLLVPSGRIDLLAQAIIRVFSDDDLRKKFSEEGLIYSRSFSWEKAAETLMSSMITAYTT